MNHRFAIKMRQLFEVSLCFVDARFQARISQKLFIAQLRKLRHIDSLLELNHNAHVTRRFFSREFG